MVVTWRDSNVYIGKAELNCDFVFVLKDNGL